jgi:hypothetical protein
MVARQVGRLTVGDSRHADAPDAKNDRSAPRIPRRRVARET